MIPEKLQLRNFMCYGEDVPPLQFDGIRVACLSGDNGAGKSAMLDAITWVLWGQARARSDDDLIMLGREEMEVVFEFLLDGRLYRVVRRRKRGKRGITTLDFQMRGQDGGWNRLSGDTIAETQQAINRTLRMEYDTFINSAFLLQGRADEFASRKPAERKQVLADILGLAEYEALERRAKDAANRYSKDLDVVKSYIQRLEAEVELRPEREQRLAEAQDQVAVLEDELASYDGDIQELREQVARLRDLRIRQQTLVKQIEQRQQDNQHLEQSLSANQKRIAEFEAVIARREAIVDGVAQWKKQREALHEMERRAEERARLKEEYYAWESKLNEVRHQLETEKRLAAEEIARLDEQLARRVHLAVEREQVAVQMGEFATLQADLNRMRDQAHALEQQQVALQRLQLQIDGLRQTITFEQEKLSSAEQDQQQRVDELSAEAAAVDQIGAELATLQREVERLDLLAGDLVARRELLTAAMQRRGELQAEAQRIETDGKQIVEKLRLVEQGEGECPVCRSELGVAGLEHIRQHYAQERDALRKHLRQVRRETADLELIIEEHHRVIRALEAETGARTDLEARRVQLELRQQQAREAQQKLAEARRALSETQRQLAERAYAREEQRQLAELERQQAAFDTLESIDQQLADLRRSMEEVERRLDQSSHLQQRLAQFDAELALIAQAERQRPAAVERYRTLEAQLQNEAYGEQERRECARIAAEGQALGYDKQQHERLRIEVEELAAWDREAMRLEQALADIDETRDQLRNSQELWAHRQRDIAEAQAEVEQLEQQLRDLPQAEVNLRDMEQHSRVLRQRLAAAQRARGSAEAELRRCEEYARELAEQRQKAAVLAEECAVYEELAQAFGKKGVQTMLIETAIPEIEHAANELLGRMTDHQMHVAFETQRGTRRGDATIETLDIRISDTLGTRDYDMFSGGEAFRVNFALRIALSKLLARRAGASLKTLILDEGFGTQDTRGRDRIVEAINAIEDEFDRILVITHIQELKDMFQSQIEITKTLSGSTWSIT